MKAYRIYTGAHIECLGDPVTEALIQNVTLAEHHGIAAAEAGCDLIDVRDEKDIDCREPYISFRDDLYLSWGILKAFLNKALREPDRPSILAIARTDESERISATQDVTVNDAMVIYPVRYMVPGSASKETPILVNVQDGMQIRKTWLDHVLPTTETFYYVTDKSIIQIITPMHLHIANMYATVNRIAGWTRRGMPAKIGRIILWIARLAGREKALMQWVQKRREARTKAVPRFAYKVLTRMNKIGANCDIHPTAIIEGSVIGNNVRVGAFAYIQFSHIADNVEVSEFAHIRLSAIGSSTQVIARARISMCVIYPRVFYVAQGMQFAVVGREAQVYSSMYADYRLDGQPLKTPFRGKYVDSCMPFLGPTIGHRAKVAAGLVLAPGRVIPNGVTVYPHRSVLVSRVPEGLKEGDSFHAGM